jgi:sugar lactone lactonase YvrE
VTAIAPDGTRRVVAAGFASYSEGVGLEGIVLLEGMLYVAVGGAGVEAGVEPLPEENAVFEIDPATGEATLLASLGAYEIANNPDGGDLTSNLYGLAAGADGQLYVADAGGNTIYQVDPTTGAVEVFAVVTTEVPDREPVPTALAVAADGVLSSTLLSEGWPADAPSVVEVTVDGTQTGVTNGLSFAVGLAVGPDGARYVSQLTTGFGAEGPLPGNVLRIDPDGSTEVVVDGLVLPHGLAFDAAGTLYVPVLSVSFGPGAPVGQVLRCDGIAAST